ncbi:L,D-transpeptidase family protein [Pseudaminobacter sp. NGMCC 1.201702]|uniref:L,D-transpeptidase family protein n=1 Tax=Pseudaminobacter sp. NGMCC 1.201702 TaxID=3391825 RepID=UPI0039F079C3
MVTKTIVLSAFLAGFCISGAQAAAERAEEHERIAGGHEEERIILAQSGDVEIYFDGNGNRVLVDSYTGEVIAVQPPRRVLRQRELRREDRYYLDDPEDMERLRRDRERGYEIYPEGPVEDYGDYSRGWRDEEFPPAPGRAFPDEELYPDQGFESEPQIVKREPVERAPLEGEIMPRTAEPQPSDRITVPGATIEPPTTFTAREDVAAIQVLMDRAGASPGVIDGKFGSNVDKALVAYRELTGTNLKSTDTAKIKEALAASGGDPFTTYTITPEDAAGPFVAAIPSDYGEKAQLGHLSYTSVAEMLAERFHMDEAYLKALNPGVNFSRPGTKIRVANVGSPVATKVQRIIADKGRKQVRAYDESGKLVAAYPATIGSAATPSPTGTHAVSRVAFDPNYTYNPKLNFKQGNNDKILTIPPGPNGPVGSIWIALDKPTYGVHGTPDPSKIGKTESHGCVRLTNWDAQELAKLVSPGVTVEFVE